MKRRLVKSNTRWYFVENGTTMPISCITRLDAIIKARPDPFSAAMDFPNCYLIAFVYLSRKRVSGRGKTSQYEGRAKIVKHQLTKKEKAFLIRRLSYA
jgi:hypothetical protein